MVQTPPEREGVLTATVIGPTSSVIASAMFSAAFSAALTVAYPEVRLFDSLVAAIAAVSSTYAFVRRSTLSILIGFSSRVEGRVLPTANNTPTNSQSQENRNKSLNFAFTGVLSRPTMTPKYAVETLAARGWTEAAIADAVGVSQPTINRIKNGIIPAWDTGHKVVGLAKAERAKRRRAAA